MSQAPTIIMPFGRTLPDLPKLPNFGNSTLTCINSLWQSRTTRFLFRWTVVRWWSQSSRENDLWRPITSEPLNGIVCEWCLYNMHCESYHLKILNLDSDNIRKFMVFGPNIPTYPQIDQIDAHNALLKMVALAPTVPIFNRFYIRNWFGPILTCFSVNKMQKGASVYWLAGSLQDPGVPSAPEGYSEEKNVG